MTRDGKAWVGDQGHDAAAGREAVITDVRGGTYLLRPVYGRAEEWTADSDAYLTVTVPQQDCSHRIPPER